MPFLVRASHKQSTVHHTKCSLAKRGGRGWRGVYYNVENAWEDARRHRPDLPVHLCNYEHWHTPAEIPQWVRHPRAKHNHDSMGRPVYHHPEAVGPDHIHDHWNITIYREGELLSYDWDFRIYFSKEPTPVRLSYPDPAICG